MPIKRQPIAEVLVKMVTDVQIRWQLLNQLLNQSVFVGQPLRVLGGVRRKKDSEFLSQRWHADDSLPSHLLKGDRPSRLDHVAGPDGQNPVVVGTNRVQPPGMAVHVALWRTIDEGVVMRGREHVSVAIAACGQKTP